ncbi:hypothetical protein [Nonomuraea sp. SBT364]|uniref:hypothetical protein n=1 Tax=Nonomuraea sp. SBT364 TaxID=1580530 RepID=UPI000B151B30|nr:hypothetical protein [Nonomuraea sp. SBT364]
MAETEGASGKPSVGFSEITEVMSSASVAELLNPGPEESGNLSLPVCQCSIWYAPLRHRRHSG